jgi:hypothetical protein
MTFATAKSAGHYSSILDRHSALNRDEYSMSGWWCLFYPDRESCEVRPLHSALAGAGLADVQSHIGAIWRLWIAERRPWRELWRLQITAKMGNLDETIGSSRERIAHDES